MKEKVVSVSLGANPDTDLDFIIIRLVEAPTNGEVQQICEALQKCFERGGSYFLREFVGNEIQLSIIPCPRHPHQLETLNEAIASYGDVLRLLGLEDIPLIVDGDLRPFDERIRCQALTT